jgi:hypothetical protein
MRVAFGGDFTRLRCRHPIAVSGRYVLKSKLADVPPVPARRIAMNENAARNLAEAPATYAKDAVERSAMAADGAFNVSSSSMRRPARAPRTSTFSSLRPHARI